VSKKYGQLKTIISLLVFISVLFASVFAINQSLNQTNSSLQDNILNITPDLGENTIKDEVYTFDEPPDLFQRVNSYGTLLSWCPEDASFLRIKDKINKIKSAIKIDIRDDEINEMVDECNEKDTFTIKGKPTSTEIDDCVDYLDDLLGNDIDPNVEYSKEDLLQECEIRDYFNERFNENTIDNYDVSLFNQLFEERDKEFIKRIIYGYEMRKVNREEGSDSSGLEENDEGSVIELKKDSEGILSSKQIKDLNEGMSILTVKDTTSSLHSGMSDEIRYIDTKETILEKSLNLPENKPVVITEENTQKLTLMGLLRKVLSFLPWFD